MLITWDYTRYAYSEGRISLPIMERAEQSRFCARVQKHSLAWLDLCFCGYVWRRGRVVNPGDVGNGSC